LTDLFGQESVQKFVVPEELIRHFVVTVDNLAEQKVAQRLRPVRPTPGMFAAGGTSGCAQKAQTAANGNSNSFGFDNRYGNSIRYDSPDFSGWTAATHLSLGESKGTDGCTPYAVSTKVQYAKGPLKAGVAYNVHHELRGEGLSDNYLLLAANYQVSQAINVGAYWQRLRYANPGLLDLKQDGFGLRGRYLLGQSTFELGWYHAGAGKGDQTPAFSGLSVGPDTKSNLYLFAYRYAIDKAMDLWAQVAQLKNGANAAYDITGGSIGAGTASTLGASPRTLSIGIKYDF
jgi:predicted porin